jgi:SNF2 family DNA or RNA helicase
MSTGIQADAMGMGKTLMCIAMICGNPPTADEMDHGRGTTLIVSPASAVKQWVSELKQHSRLDAMVYSERKDIPIGILEKCQVM